MGARRIRLIFAFAGALALVACDDRSRDEPKSPPVQFQRASADLVEHGHRLADVLGCTGCHGPDLTGKDWSEPGFGRLWTANLTLAIRRYDDAALERAIRGGVRPDRELWEMPSHLFTQLTSDDMAALIAFLRSRPATGKARPEPMFEAGAKAEITAGTFKSSHSRVAEDGAKWPPSGEPALGRYIARATCAECHRLDLKGGQPNPAARPRPDLTIVAPAYDRAAFATLLRTGKAIGNRELEMMSDVARRRYSRLTQAEVAALHAYLRAAAKSAP